MTNTVEGDFQKVADVHTKSAGAKMAAQQETHLINSISFDVDWTNSNGNMTENNNKKRGCQSPCQKMEPDVSYSRAEMLLTNNAMSVLTSDTLILYCFQFNKVQMFIYVLHNISAVFRNGAENQIIFMSMKRC